MIHKMSEFNLKKKKKALRCFNFCFNYLITCHWKFKITFDVIWDYLTQHMDVYVHKSQNIVFASFYFNFNPVQISTMCLIFLVQISSVCVTMKHLGALDQEILDTLWVNWGAAIFSHLEMLSRSNTWVLKTAAPLISSLSISFFYMTDNDKTCRTVRRYGWCSRKSWNALKTFLHKALVLKLELWKFILQQWPHTMSSWSRTRCFEWG